MTTALARPDGRTLAIAASIGMHLVLLAATGGRMPRMVPREHERLAFTVVPRPSVARAPESPTTRTPSAAARGERLRATRSSAPVSVPSAPPLDATTDAPPRPSAPAPSEDRGGGASDSATGSGGPTTGGSTAMMETGTGFDAAGYGRGLHALVGARKQYPVLARRMGLEGAARLRVRVHADGTLDGPPVVTTSSGHQLLDREALRMVEAAAPFPAFTGSGRGTLTLVLTIRFALDDV